MPADFAKARREAVRLLLASRLYSARIDVTRLKYDKNIIFDSFSNFCHNSLATVAELESCDGMRDGCTIIRKTAGNTLYLILFNDKVKSRRRKSFTLAHEVGHVMLNHESDGAVQESEANCFAAELLLPRILVRELQKGSSFRITAHEVADIFAVSKAVCENQMESLMNNHNFSDDERVLLKKQTGFLPEYNSPVIDC